MSGNFWIDDDLQEARDLLEHALSTYRRAGQREGYQRVQGTRVTSHIDLALTDLDRVIRANQPPQPQPQVYRVNAEVSVVIEAAGAEDALNVARGRLLAAGFDVHSGITAEAVR